MKYKVTVLMSTYNGEKYIKQQLDSIFNQKDVNVKLLVRDDGSTDDTCKILEYYKKRKNLKWYSGKNKKTAKSFIDLINHVASDSDYYSFSDQDDVWKNTKLLKSIQNIEKIKGPALYAGNYELVNSNLEPIKNTNIHLTTTNFNEALVYSCCTGCTVVINKELLKILQGKYPKYLFMHDDWIHKVCLAVGGKVVYDSDPRMLYRQHSNNVEGGKHNYLDKFTKIINDKKNNSHIMRNQLKELLRLYKDQLTLKNYNLACNLIKKSEGNLFSRIKIAFDPKYTIVENKKLNREFRISLILNYW